MAFNSRVQGTGTLKSNGVTGTQSYGSFVTSNFGVGNLVIVGICHYAFPNTDVVTGVNINGVAAGQRSYQADPTFDVNQVMIYDIVNQVAGSKTVDVTLSGTGAPDGHFLLLAIAEFSFTGALSRLVATPTSGTSTSPSNTSDASAAAGDLIFSNFVIGDGRNITITPPAATSPAYTTEYSEGDSVNNEGGACVSRIIPSGGAQVVTWTSTGTAYPWSDALILYKAIAAAAQVANSQYFAAASL